MLVSLLLAMLTVVAVSSDITPILKFPLNRQYGGRAISEDFSRINVDNVNYTDGPFGCKDGAISFKSSFLKLNISNHTLSMNESFSIFMLCSSPAFYYPYSLHSSRTIVAYLLFANNMIRLGSPTATLKNFTGNFSKWMHVGLSWSARNKILSAWINGAVVFNHSFNFDPNKNVTDIYLLDSDLNTEKQVSCLAIYDKVIRPDEVKTIFESCKTCQVEKSCSIKLKERENCGYLGIGKRNCLNRGCCWDKCMKRGQRCFYDKTSLKNSCDNVAPWYRMQCGRVNVLKQECEAKNCCYDDTIPKGPKCFNRPATKCEQDVEERKNCGFYGIGKRNCLRRSCCWDKTQKKGKRCFYEKGAVTNDCYTIPKARRERCGKPGIYMKECQQLNCCFDKTVINGIKCFVKPIKTFPFY